MSINTVSSREKGKALQSAVICIDCPQEDIFSKAIHFTMGEGNKPVPLAMGRNPGTITFIIDGTVWLSLIHSQFHNTLGNVLNNRSLWETSWKMTGRAHMNIIAEK